MWERVLIACLALLMSVIFGLGHQYLELLEDSNQFKHNPEIMLNEPKTVEHAR